jgi:ABC-type nitrate/sulfonate/bicarbonate transport system substrate-binding protein
MFKPEDSMAKHGFKVLWQRYIDKKSKQLASGEPGRRERIRRTISAVLEAAAWQRANRSEAVKIIATRYRISQNEAERSYDTITVFSRPTRDAYEKGPRLSEPAARGTADSRRTRSGEAGGFLHAAISSLIER